MKYVALRDRRLEGGVPARSNLGIINTDGATSLRRAFHEILGHAGKTGRIDTLFVLCHGYAGENTRALVCMDAGGMGLELGQESVLHSNVMMWSAIRGKVQDIVIYACAAADTQPGNEDTDADGQKLMRSLALATGATVYAADRIQWYYPLGDLKNGRFEWGSWEGRLLMFRPGMPGFQVGAPRVDFADVMKGRAH